MFNVRTLSIVLAIIMVFGLASLAFAQPGAFQTAGTATTTATATARAAAPTSLPTTGGTLGGANWMLPFLAFVVLFLVAGLGLNLARRAQ